MDKKYKRLLLLLPAIIVLTLAGGFILGTKMQASRQYMQIPQLSGLGSMNKVGFIMDLIDQQYVDSLNLTEIEDEAIPLILENLDPHSAYIPAKDMKAVNEEMKGNFGGIGVQFSIQKDTVMVIDVVSGGPSQKLGILAGDRIVLVNDSLIAGVGVTNSVVMENLRGEMGTLVKVSIARVGVPDLIHFDIERGEIPVKSVDVSYQVDENTGYIKVSRFGAKTYDEFMAGIDKLNQSGVSNIMVDLRGNTGGYLGIVIRMVNEFLDKGELIVYTEGKAKPKQIFKADRTGSCVDKNIVIMIDEFSASASEIFAGAVQDNDRGIIVGRRSFGKGLVQEQIPFRDGSALRLTVSRYYTPSGRCIQKPYDKGIEEYHKDIAKRMMHGETLEKDSIVMSDSLAYKTKKGRTVYGGGGIMPDVFVPVDTTGYSTYFASVTSLIYQFGFQFTDSHRKKLEILSSIEEVESYLDNQNIMDKFIIFAKSKGVEPDKDGIKISGEIIETQLKAYVSRNIFDDNGFYPIIHKIDKTFKVALEEIESME